jgi:hypothetical protein
MFAYLGQSVKLATVNADSNESEKKKKIQNRSVMKSSCGMTYNVIPITFCLLNTPGHFVYKWEDERVVTTLSPHPFNRI